jgi:hypothetical protein
MYTIYLFLSELPSDQVEYQAWPVIKWGQWWFHRLVNITREYTIEVDRSEHTFRTTSPLRVGTWTVPPNIAYVVYKSNQNQYAIKI